MTLDQQIAGLEATLTTLRRLRDLFGNIEAAAAPAHPPRTTKRRKPPARAAPKRVARAPRPASAAPKPAPPRVRREVIAARVAKVAEPEPEPVPEPATVAVEAPPVPVVAPAAKVRKPRYSPNASKRGARPLGRDKGRGAEFLRCKLADVDEPRVCCNGLVSVAKATQHLWDVHGVAARAGEQEKYFEPAADVPDSEAA